MTSFPSLARFVSYVLTVAALLIALPLVALAFFNHPSPTDDYCFANTAMRYGFWEAQQIYYDGWSGRFFHNFIVHSSPLVIGWYGGYKVYPIVLLGLLMLGCHALASQWLPGAGRWARLGLGAGLFVLYVGTLDSMPEFLYWYSGMACYSLSAVLLPYLLATLLAHQRRGFGPHIGYLLAESLLALGIIGSSETSMVMAMSVLALVTFGELVLERRVSITMVVLLVVGAIGCFYVIKAPGNAIRMGSNPHSSDFLFTVMSSVKYTITYLFSHIFQTALLPLSLLYLPVAYRLTDQRPLPVYLRLHPLLALLHGGTTVLVLISLHFYGVGMPPAHRIINVTNLFFYLSWTYTLTLLVAAFRSRLAPERWLKLARPVVALALGWVVLTTVLGPIVVLTYSDWLSGKAAQYDRAMEARYRLMSQTGDTSVMMTPLASYPASMYMEDVKGDPQHLWNRCWADYFHKKTIVLTNAPTPAAP